jgi:hypothetical protein
MLSVLEACTEPVPIASCQIPQTSSSTVNHHHSRRLCVQPGYLLGSWARSRRCHTS